MIKRCYECMEPIEDAEHCPNCGFDNNAASQNEDDVHLKLGSLLKGRYYIGNIFSKSLDFTVYLAYDEELQKKVFVREFTGEKMAELSGKYTDMELKHRFLSYAKATATINMCEILPHTIDAFAELQGCYLVTDYFDGESLKTLLSSGINISSANALKMVQQLLRGLKHIHNSGVVFGSISPETLYVLKNGEIRLFGVVSSFYDFLEDIDSRVEVFNPSYAAPEIFSETEKTGAYTDVYSAAAILYRLLTNKIPAISFLRSGGENLITPRKIDKNIPKNLEIALLNALNWQIETRTASPKKFLNELSAKKAKRRLSAFIIWANVLGFLQAIYDNFTVKKAEFEERKQKVKSQKKPKQKVKLLWLWITLPAVILVAVIILLFILKSPDSTKDGGNLSSALSGNTEEWYYGSGIETPGNSSKYVYGGYSSKKPVSSKKKSSSSKKESSEHISSKVSSENASSEVSSKATTTSEESSSSKIASSSEILSSSKISSSSEIASELPSSSEEASSEDPNIIECPSLVGLTLEQAKKELKKKDLSLGEITYEKSTDYYPNYVIRQTPENGEKVPKGSKVNLVVCKGEELPDVAGLSMSEAKEKLSKAGFLNTQYKFEASDKTVGSVIGAYFESETNQTTSDKVIIAVSGEETDPVSDYSNKTVAEAKALSPEINFVFVGEDGAEIPAISDTDAALYKVVSQDVPANSPAYKGMKVTLTVVAEQN